MRYVLYITITWIIVYICKEKWRNLHQIDICSQPKRDFGESGGHFSTIPNSPTNLFKTLNVESLTINLMVHPIVVREFVTHDVQL